MKGAAVLLEANDYKLLKLILEDDRNKDDVFLFQSRGEGHMRGHTAIKNMCEELVLERPQYMRATCLRRYLATVIQVSIQSSM